MKIGDTPSIEVLYYIIIDWYLNNNQIIYISIRNFCEIENVFFVFSRRYQMKIGDTSIFYYRLVLINGYNYTSLHNFIKFPYEKLLKSFNLGSTVNRKSSNIYQQI